MQDNSVLLYQLLLKKPTLRCKQSITHTYLQVYFTVSVHNALNGFYKSIVLFVYMQELMGSNQWDKVQTTRHCCTVYFVITTNIWGYPISINHRNH